MLCSDFLGYLIKPYSLITKIAERLKQIVVKERVAIDEGGYEALIFAADGDMRSAINNLQATHVGAGAVTKQKVFEICDIPDIEKLKKIIESCISGNREAAFTIMKELHD